MLDLLGAYGLLPNVRFSPILLQPPPLSDRDSFISLRRFGLAVVRFETLRVAAATGWPLAVRASWRAVQDYCGAVLGPRVLRTAHAISRSATAPLRFATSRYVQAPSTKGAAKHCPMENTIFAPTKSFL